MYVSTMEISLRIRVINADVCFGWLWILRWVYDLNITKAKKTSDIIHQLMCWWRGDHKDKIIPQPEGLDEQRGEGPIQSQKCCLFGQESRKPITQPEWEWKLASRRWSGHLLDACYCQYPQRMWEEFCWEWKWIKLLGLITSLAV